MSTDDSSTDNAEGRWFDSSQPHRFSPQLLPGQRKFDFLCRSITKGGRPGRRGSRALRTAVSSWRLAGSMVGRQLRLRRGASVCDNLGEGAFRVDHSLADGCERAEAVRLWGPDREL